MLRRTLSLLALFALLADVALASPHSGTVNVHGYTRRDGTHVAGYTRSAPGSSESHTAHTTHPYSGLSYGTGTHHSSEYCSFCSRDAHGRIERSESARREFMRKTGYPDGRPGYVVDHIVPLKRGGADEPSNMQWQTVEEAKAKDRLE